MISLVLQADTPTIAMRLFIALNLPEREKDRIHRTVRRLKEARAPVRWVDPVNYHVTLAFLGEVPLERVGPVRDALNRVASKTRGFTMELKGIGAFPTLRRPRVIWLGIKASSRLRRLDRDLERALGPIGFEGDGRAFHPHVTLGRVKTKGGSGTFPHLQEMGAKLDHRAQIEMRRVDLMRSHLSKSGVRYSLMESGTLRR